MLFQEIIVFKISPGGGEGVYSQLKAYKWYPYTIPTNHVLAAY